MPASLSDSPHRIRCSSCPKSLAKAQPRYEEIVDVGKVAPPKIGLTCSLVFVEESAMKDL